jgi:CAAX prenyl protease-like protein
LSNWSTCERYLWLAFRIFGAIVIVPVAEELAFRGYLYRRLKSQSFEAVDLTKWYWLPALLSSVLFGILHPDRALAGTIAGLAYLALMVRRGSITEAIIAHGITNALLAGYVLLTNSWKLW